MTTHDKLGRTDYDVSAERFIEVWQRSHSVDEVAETLKMPKPIVLARKSNYTKIGILLKKMPRKNQERGLDVARLNALIQRLDAERAHRTVDADQVDTIIAGMKRR